MKLSDFKNKVKTTVREMGGVNAVLFFSNRLFSCLPVTIHKYYFFAQELSGKKLLPKHRGAGISIEEVSIEKILKMPLPRPEIVIKSRFEQGAVCLSAFLKNEFTGCFWYVEGQYIEDEVRCVYDLPSSNSIFDFDVYVAPKYRLSPVFLRLWEEIGMRLVKENKNWSLSRISAFNVGSLSSHKRMGAVIIGWAFFLGIGNNFQLTISNLTPFIHFSFKKNTFPIFKLNIPT